ncbi:Acm1p CYBJADRAFT_172508 [Cyberlindnera jadinii NRRL Y-1542]|uniref:Uncharacterized protein n=1 Tax=Cyberlindnera jadinii (strain ATCC 18201 / CBS 1600 / BCRC 20928 / JCM 3617 / NBRC 0987 / NRRL Y-1542) TaxID=983966 RepID=A0A1E4S4S3_CYBJN|nr:hypothetical protein CYBJADRAFT_172508 [Cyberlindnera jadinii NRRL Y-1542]ODV74537.1 hypothetical protein CYBJADRAFT_172508 [Cyberlindnera jadinii NRRL Y-1542]
MLSRTPSPAKRQALSSKDSNSLSSQKKGLVRTTLGSRSPSKSPNKSPNKSPSKSPSKSPTRSPTKSQQQVIDGGLFTKPVPKLGFKIFEDATDYTNVQRIATASICDENDVVLDKENRTPCREVKRHKRAPMKDLNIAQFPSYIHYHAHNSRLGDGATGTYLLDTKWTGDGKIVIPSYVTPPRKDRVRYITMGTNNASVKRSHSETDLQKDKAVKRLVFSIHDD